MIFSMIPRNPFPHSLSELANALGGNKCDGFFSSVFSYLGISDGIFLSSGREAFYHICRVLLKRGDELVMPAFSCNVLLPQILELGIKPVFADVNRCTLNMGVKEVSLCISPKTRAVLVTHQFGYPADMDDLSEYCTTRNLLIIEDAAPAFGAQYHGRFVGTMGIAGFYSFQYSKVLSCISGGLIVGDQHVLSKIRETTENSSSGSSTKWFLKGLGCLILSQKNIYKILMDIWYLLNHTYSNADHIDLKASSHGNKIKYLSRWQCNLGFDQKQDLEAVLAMRNATAELYTQELGSIGGVELLQTDLRGKTHAYSRFSLVVHERNKIFRIARRMGVDLGLTFSYFLPQYFHFDESQYPNSVYLKHHIVNVPITRRMAMNSRIVEIVKKAVNEVNSSTQ